MRLCVRGDASVAALNPSTMLAHEIAFPMDILSASDIFDRAPRA